MPICLAGLRSIPDDIYEAAEVDRASPWRQFWSITLPKVLPFLMLAVLFRVIENFKMFDMVNLLTSGGPGSTTVSRLDRPEARGLREVAHRLLLGFRHHPVRYRLRRREHLREGPEQGEAARTPPAIRSSKPRRAPRHSPARSSSSSVITIVPLLWIGATAFKSPSDSIAYPPKVFFKPTLEGYVNLFTVRSRQTPESSPTCRRPRPGGGRLVRSHDMVIAGPSQVVPRFMNSLIIGFGSTFLAVFLGTLAAYAFSRFRVPLADDLLFFILSTRTIPPIAVAIPIYLMIARRVVTDTHIGMIALYTAVNVSLAVWPLKGFIDEIPVNTRRPRSSTATHGFRPSARWCCRRR